MYRLTGLGLITWHLESLAELLDSLPYYCLGQPEFTITIANTGKSLGTAGYVRAIGNQEYLIYPDGSVESNPIEPLSLRWDLETLRSQLI